MSTNLRCFSIYEVTSSFFLTSCPCRLQHQSDNSPVRPSSRFSSDLRATDGSDLKLNGCLPAAYDVDMLHSDVTCELIEFGLVGGPQPYPNDALWKLPCW